MAITVTTLRQGTYSAEFAIEMTADADTVVLFNHGLPGAPASVTITPLLATAYVGQYRLTQITATQIEITKGNIVGSGSAGAAVRIQALFYHSIQQ